MIGIEIVNPLLQLDKSNNPVADGKLANRIKEHYFKKGLIVETSGRFGAVLRFLPALTIKKELLEEVVGILGDVFRKLSNEI